MSTNRLVNVRGTQLLAGDTREHYRQKIARITLDSMVQFVGLLDAQGTVLEINYVALDAVGVKLSDVEGRPFWTTFWWQVSEEINQGLREAIRRAAQGEFVRWDTEIYGRAGGKETIIIDASLMPVKDEHGTVVFITAEGRDITEKKAQEREIARQREELAELDKLKTQFFANISHEFRTPLTLMMGPLEDALAGAGLSAANRERLELAHRNSLRLFKLVNTLLDFSRIEANRIHGAYEPVDLAALTAELASVFRSAIERAGMRLVIDCPPLPEMVYVDREMWEKIVLNLLSNAFKFTFAGEIGVSLRVVDSAVEMRVRDTGTGIPADEIPRLFERFHRVKGARGRSYEGSGIGLALVQELVRRHGGTVAVESTMGKGTTFRVLMLFGKAHLPAEHVGSGRELASTAVRAEAYVEEALRWHTQDPLPRVNEDVIEAVSANSARADLNSGKRDEKVLVVDDNADMRDYVYRLLAGPFTVLTAANGEEALSIAQAELPDLVLTDIMMPVLDGFGLLQALRSDPATRTIPVIFLSARAGEEAGIEGRDAGADDYLVKPFSARELLARVGAHLKLARVRKDVDARLRESEERFRALVNASSDVVYRMSPDWSEMRQLDGRGFISDATSPIHNWTDKYIHPDDQPAVLRAIGRAIQTKSIFELEHRVRRVDGTLGWTLSRAVPLFNESGDIIEWFGAASDITARKEVEQALRTTEKLAATGRLAATVAHEINNPLAAVTNLVYLAKHDVADTKKVVEYLELAGRELDRVALIARQTLGFYRDTSSPIRFNVTQTLDDLLSLYEMRFQTRQIRVVRRYDKDVEITAFAGEIRQVFSNLISNSMDALQDGGALIVKVSKSRAWSDPELPGVRVTILDTGAGITAQDMNHLFQPFFTTKADFGTGLGLWITQNIVEKHGGTIHVKSRTGPAKHGTAFSIFLPMDEKGSSSRSSVMAETSSTIAD